jgi:hypothetical protein
LDRLYIHLSLLFSKPHKRRSADGDKHWRPQGKVYSLFRQVILYSTGVLNLFQAWGHIHPLQSTRGPQDYKWRQSVVTPLQLIKKGPYKITPTTANRFTYCSINFFNKIDHHWDAWNCFSYSNISLSGLISLGAIRSIPQRVHQRCATQFLIWRSKLRPKLKAAHSDRKSKKVKLSRYTPWRHMGGEEV